MELQIREGAVTQAITEFMQARVFSTCMTSGLPDLYVDHLDTVPASVELSDSKGGGIDVKLRIAIYVVTQTDLEAHWNATPSGAQTPVGEIGVVIGLVLVDSKLTISSAFTDASTLPLPPAAQTTVQRAADAVVAQFVGTTLFDTAPMMATFSTPAAVTPRLARGGGIIAIQIGPMGPVTSQLAANQDWGVFLSVEETEDLLSTRLPDGLITNLSWQPNGSTPSIVGNLNASVDLSDIDLADVTLSATANPTYVPPDMMWLSIHWDVSVGGIGHPFEDRVRDAIRDQILAKTPTATHDGPQDFHFSIPLPAISPFLGARPLWGSLSSSTAGMTLGGPVIAAPAAGRKTLDASYKPFGRPEWWGHCRERSRTGDGKPPRTFTASAVQVLAYANFSNAGALCGAQVLHPNEWLEMSASENGLTFNLSVAVARMVTADVCILVQTARGTRLVNLGKPVIQVSDDGHIANVQVNWFNDCLYLSGVALKLATGAPVTPSDFRPPPSEDPNWVQQLAASLGLNSSVVTIDGLEPGELVSLRSQGVQLDVTANATGVATVPALIGLARDMREATIERISRKALTGNIRVQTTEFRWLATVGPAVAAAIRDVDGAAQITRRVGERVQVEEYRPDEQRSFVILERSGDAMIDPQPLPPSPGDATRLASAAGLQDVVLAQHLPGGNDRRTVLAQFRDGGTVLVEGDERGVRVTGRYFGPMVGMLTDGRYGIAISGHVLHLFSMASQETVAVRR
jgi:hypothetical protein